MGEQWQHLVDLGGKIHFLSQAVTASLPLLTLASTTCPPMPTLEILCILPVYSCLSVTLRALALPILEQHSSMLSVLTVLFDLAINLSYLNIPTQPLPCPLKI